MAVDKELLELDLYALLGVVDKATDKEVREARAVGEGKPYFNPF